MAATAVISVAIAATAHAHAGLDEMPLPGGSSALARAAGLDPALEPWRVVLEVIRRVHLTRGGAAVAGAVAVHLHEAGTTAPGTEVTALPLTAAAWNAAVFGTDVPPHELLARILADREASLLYHGLLDMDAETRAFLADEPRTLRTIHRRHAAAFAVFGGSFRVHGGRVEVPGGDDAREAWERILRADVDRPADFLVALCARADGRLAYLYDTVARLEPEGVRWILGLDLDARTRERRLAALQRAFERVRPWWTPDGFVRPAVDATRVLREIRLRDGRPTPPARRALWQVAFSEGPLPISRPIDADPDEFDAAWLVENVANAPSPADRLDALAFAQRHLGRDDVPAPELVLTLRGFMRYPALLLVLERIGVRDVGLLAAAVRRAHALSDHVDPHRAALAVVQFQGALALVDRARSTGALDAARAEGLVRALVELPTRGVHRYYGAVASFIDDALLPSLAGGGPPETRLARALTGASSATAPVRWRDATWTVSDVEVERERLLRTLRRLGGNPLDHVLDFCRTAAALAEAPPTAEAREAHVLALVEAADGLAPAALGEGAPSADAVAAAADVERLARTGPLDGAGAPRQLAQPAIAAGETLLAASLATLLYAVHLGPSGSSVLGAGHVVGRHELGVSALTERAGTELERAAWRLPRVAHGHPWRLRGALLALDTALAPFALRRMSDELPVAAPRLAAEADRAGFAQGVALLNREALTDASRDELVGAVRRGRGLVERAGTDPGALERLASTAGLAGWRRNALLWLAERDPAQLSSFFTLSELRRIGEPRAGMDAWGMPDVPTGGLLPRLPPARSADDLLGYQGRIAPAVPDLNLRVAEALAERGLPSRLAPPLLAFAVQDLVDAAWPAGSADGYSVARHARDLPPSRIDAYLSALAEEGVLRPVPDGDAAPTDTAQ